MKEQLYKRILLTEKTLTFFHIIESKLNIEDIYHLYIISSEHFRTIYTLFYNKLMPKNDFNKMSKDWLYIGYYQTKDDFTCKINFIDKNNNEKPTI